MVLPSLAYYNRDGGEYGVAIVNHTSVNHVNLIQLTSLGDASTWDITTLSESGAWANITQEDNESGEPKYCWTDQGSSPFEIMVGPSGGFSPRTPLVVEHKRRGVVQHEDARLTLEFEPMKIVTSDAETTLVAFKPSSLREKGITLSNMWDYLGSDATRLPANAKWLVVSKEFASSGQSAAERRFSLRVHNTSGNPVGSLDTSASSGKVTVDVASYAGMNVILRPQVTLVGIDPDSVTVGVGDVYTAPEAQMRPKPGQASRNEDLPKEFALSQNYPNPFNPTTNIRFDLPVDSRLTVEIYNVLGQRVKTLLREDRQGGYHTVKWNGTGDHAQSLGSGTYFLRFSAAGINGESFNEIRKLMLLK